MRSRMKLAEGGRWRKGGKKEKDRREEGSSRRWRFLVNKLEIGNASNHFAFNDINNKIYVLVKDKRWKITMKDK